MRVEGLAIAEVLLITRERHEDERGWFTELYNHAEHRQAGLGATFVQDNVSRSLPGVVRGLHFQVDPAQGKLVTCLEGQIFDVAVDIRPDSETFGQHVAVELSGDGSHSLWVPPGFAHGFAVLGDLPATLIYKVDAPRSEAGERGIRWDDPDLAIPWPVREPRLSVRDRRLPSFAEYRIEQR